ncbi:GAF and ANTAR domain-containing protein [Aeromicrobium senzhongii]|uniref:GAF and ANTAR domain-containing protein n=1 Tax=Aeromicrobium senzhongii TaxID=2663859 RepID=A0ABX6SR17_9ACTN|nr:GAF and ANTAR domain-containing protein [Aeromicrobium senzhongii]MTB86984.1 ANTAR domain-containing protein [Aeromicrobium senzhongii]QNL93190.1 GAF and ANTAR domain-containing protein [Aeromicrobium senzhongii]
MDQDFHRLLIDMAAEVHEAPEQAVRHITEYARTAVKGEDSGIMLAKAKGRVETFAGTSAPVEIAHDLQAELDEGPCLDAIRTGASSYLVVKLPDARWPRWSLRARDLGYRSTISARMEAAGRRFGSLNVYDTREVAFTRADLEVLELLASHAAVAYANAETNVNLRVALDSRNVIGQAQGVLMQVYDLDAETAFAYLRRISQTENVRLIEVAQELLRTRSLTGHPGLRPESAGP